MPKIGDSITEGGLNFRFPAGWKASKFDDWSFYTKRFQKVGNAVLLCGTKDCGQELRCPSCGKSGHVGMKAVDILAIEGASCCWYIEVKDYRLNPRAKAIHLSTEIALKVRDTLACIAAARANADDAEEKAMAIDASKVTRLRVALHLEQRQKNSKLFPRAFDPADVQQKLKQLIKAIDPHPLVTETTEMRGAAWSVTAHSAPYAAGASRGNR